MVATFELIGHNIMIDSNDIEAGNKVKSFFFENLRHNNFPLDCSDFDIGRDFAVFLES